MEGLSYPELDWPIAVLAMIIAIPITWAVKAIAAGINRQHQADQALVKLANPKDVSRDEFLEIMGQPDCSFGRIESVDGIARFVVFLDGQIGLGVASAKRVAAVIGRLVYENPTYACAISQQVTLYWLSQPGKMKIRQDRAIEFQSLVVEYLRNTPPRDQYHTGLIIAAIHTYSEYVYRTIDRVEGDEKTAAENRQKETAAVKFAKQRQVLTNNIKRGKEGVKPLPQPQPNLPALPADIPDFADM